MPAGRPSKYDPAYCKKAVDFLSDGYSITALAGSLGIGISTLYDWEKAFPEFSAALKVGRAGATKWWEDKARDAAEQGNATAIVFGLKNRASNEWRDKVETEHSGEVKLTGVQVEFVNPEAKS